MEMENQNSKAGTVAMEALETTRGAKQARVMTSELILRVLALVLTLVAAIAVGVAKQTKVVPVTVLPTLPPLNVPVSAKFHYLSAFVYFVVANAIASSYAALSLVVSLINSGGGKKNLMPTIIFLDLIMVALLFSGNGAAAAIGIMGLQGNSHVRWNKVCNVFGRFCNQVATAIVISGLASLAFLLLVFFAALRLHKIYK